MYNAYSQREVKDYAPTQMTSCNRASSASAVLIKKPQYRIRKLTPKECWLLQAFPDEAFEKAKSAGISNSQLYKLAGNSITVGVLYYIYKELYKAMPYLFDDLKLSSYFSGIGAFEMALDKLYADIGGNYQLVNFCEFDKYATKAYCAIHDVDESLNLGDIIEVDENTLAPFNMICGGSPCQDFSYAGNMKGSVWICSDCKEEYNPLTVKYENRNCCPNCGGKNISKTRSSLLVEWLRVIHANKPKWCIYENVKAITGKKFKPMFDMFVNELNECGYNVYYDVLNTKDYGVPQNRERLYLIAISKDIDNGTFIFPEPFDNGVRLKDILEDEVDEKFYITNEKADKLIDELVENGELSDGVAAVNDNNGLSRTIKAQYQQTSIANLTRTDSFGSTGVINDTGE